MTAVANAVFTAAQFNTHVRDNLNETAAAKATQSGTIFAATGLNSLAERIPTLDFVDTSQTTASGSFTDLATVGPTATVTSGSRILVCVASFMANSTAGANCRVGVDISGATTLAAQDQNCWEYESSNANDEIQGSWVAIYPGMTAGSNTLRLKYRVSAGTGTFANRRITVVPF